MIEAARAYIARVRWKFAGILPQWPHEYTVKDWRREWAEDFEAFCRLIAEEGSCNLGRRRPPVRSTTTTTSSSTV